MSPAEIDAVLSDVWQRGQDAAGRLAQLKRPAAWRVAQDELVARYQAEFDQARRDAAPYEAEYARRGGWRRYFLVTNDGGHVHSGTGCSTCFPTTQYAWLVGLADKSEAEMVAEFGEAACTVCFPTAPTMTGFGDGTSAQARRTQAERDKRAAEKVTREADKATKAITAPDGRPLRVGYDVLRTKVAAQRKLSDVVQAFGWYGPTHPDDFAAQAHQLVEALAAAGIDPEPIIDRAARKALKENAAHDLRVALAPSAG